MLTDAFLRGTAVKLRPSILGAGLLLGAAACMDLATTPTAATAAAAQSPPARADAQSSPQLLVCPATQTQRTTAIVGLLGGIVDLGGARIEIPFGAILQPTLLEIVVPESQYMEVEVHAVGLTSFLFHRAVDITIDYSRCGPDAIPPGAQLQGVYIDGDSKAVLQQMGGVDDRASHSITFSTGHLSGYAVAY
ncbi:MAG: hypothetical protein JWM41_931 [Gemmatimonadetes bacterium]|nr:hypothetical protein [Gemmatimonadota bacterium]